MGRKKVVAGRLIITLDDKPVALTNHAVFCGGILIGSGREEGAYNG
ncbi:hypothetical protein AAG584_14755 [Vreelandella titanicae]|nr:MULTISPECIES: hypothetical protein [unclassified Halomonas]